MGDGESHPSHFPTAQRLGRLARGLLRPRNTVILIAGFVFLWIVGTLSVGSWAVRSAKAQSASGHWPDVAIFCARWNPLMMVHLRRIAFDDLRERDGRTEFTLLLGTVGPERGRELGMRMGQAILTDLDGPDAQGWSASPWALYNWVMALKPLNPELALEVARKGLGVLPQGSSVHMELHRIIDISSVPSDLRRIEPSLTLSVPESLRTGVYVLSFHPVESFLVAVHSDGLIAFDLETGAMREFAAGRFVTDFAIDPTGEVLALLDRNTRHVHFYNWESGAETVRWGVPHAEPQHLHFLTDDDLLVHWKYAQPNMQIWNLSQAAVTSGYAVTEEPTSHLNLDFSGHRFASRWLLGPQVTVHDAWSGALIGPSAPQLPRLDYYALFDGGERLLLLSYPRRGTDELGLTVWDVETGTISQTASAEPGLGREPIDLHRDSHVGLLDPYRGFLILERGSLAPSAILSAPFTRFPAITVSPDGSLVALGSYGAAEILVYDLTELDTSSPTP